MTCSVLDEHSNGHWLASDSAKGSHWPRSAVPIAAARKRLRTNRSLNYAAALQAKQRRCFRANLASDVRRFINT
jgi:hypothetical protein